MPTLRHRSTSLLSRASRLESVAPEGPTSARCSPGGGCQGGPQALSEGDAVGALYSPRRGCHQPCGASPTKPLPRRPNKVSQRRAKPGSSKLSRRSLSEKPMHTRMSPSSPQHHHALTEDCSPLYPPAALPQDEEPTLAAWIPVLKRAASCSPTTGVHRGLAGEHSMPSVTPRHQVRSGHLVSTTRSMPPRRHRVADPGACTPTGPGDHSPGLVQFPGRASAKGIPFPPGLLASLARCDIGHTARAQVQIDAPS
jgi:hypothetical protein